MEIYRNLNNTAEDPPGKRCRHRERESIPDGRLPVYMVVYAVSSEGIFILLCVFFQCAIFLCTYRRARPPSYVCLHAPVYGM